MTTYINWKIDKTCKVESKQLSNTKITILLTYIDIVAISRKPIINESFTIM